MADKNPEESPMDKSPKKKEAKFKVSYEPAKLRTGLTWRFLQVCLGAGLTALAMNLFVEPAGLLPGGFVGLSKLIQRIVLDQTGIHISYALLNISLNLIPAIYAFFNIGRKFLSLSVFCMVLSSILIDLLPVFPITQDIILATVFAGVMNGIGLSIILNANACAGGTDFIAMSVSNKKNMTIWNEIMIFSVVILIISAIYFDVDKALYSIIFQFISTQMINLGHLRYQRRTCFVVTPHPEPLAQELMKITRHGITCFKGNGAYSGKEQYLLYMVVNRTDIPKIKRYLAQNAPHTFLNVTDSEQLGGNFFVEPMD